MKIARRIVPVVVVLVILGAVGCRRSGKLQSITVNPAQAIIAVGTTQQFSATAAFSDGSSLNWTSASAWGSASPDLASVGTLTGSYGLVTALSATTGPVGITALDVANSISGSATIYVTATPLVAVQITPVNEIISSGTTTQFAATGTFADGTLADGVTYPLLTPFLTWSSSNTAVATVSNTAGSIGLVTAVGPGAATITATDPVTNTSDYTTLFVQ